jgi:hypothetical protein
MKIQAIVICIFLSFSVLAEGKSNKLPSLQIAQISMESVTMEVENEIRRAELRRLEAERLKLELEAKEIERRLNARWWEGHNLTQYLLAIVITAALLFGWTRVYLEPILRKEAEVNKLAEERNATLNELLEARVEKIQKQRTDVTNEKNQIEKVAENLRTEKLKLVSERDQLKIERENLRKQQQALRSNVAGLKLAVEKADKGEGTFFSILNSDDPINALKSHGWKVWSDNYFGRLGYYLVIQHDNVLSGKEIIVGRVFEIDELREDASIDWGKYIEKINERNGPVLALDYSYLSLLVNEEAPVGGIFYLPKKGGIEFYVPLSQWSEKMAELFDNE